MRVTCSQRPTIDICQQTARHHIQEVQHVRKLIGGEDQSIIFHQELQSLDEDDRNKLLMAAGITDNIPPEQGLAVKADLGIPWNKVSYRKVGIKNSIQIH